MPKVEDYEHLPIEYIHFYPDLAIHPNRSGRIVVNYPGYRGVIDGYEGKHKKLAQFMQGESFL